MTLHILNKEIITMLSPHHTQGEAQSLARILLEDMTNKPWKLWALNTQMQVTPEQQLDVENKVQRIIGGEPIQYVIGYEWFDNRKFKVSPDVLIPRGETESLVYWMMKNITEKTPIILDIGTGSGCIALSLWLNLIQAGKAPIVKAWDISKAAINVAIENNRSLRASVDFCVQDIFNPEIRLTPYFHYIVSNPPYVPAKEAEEMATHVKDYEPSLALFVPDENPLLFYEKIMELALKILQPGGSLYFEIHPPFAAKIYRLFEEKGFSEIKLKTDIHGKERMIRAVLPLEKSNPI